MLSKRNKLMLLLLDRDNPLWDRLTVVEVDGKTLHKGGKVEKIEFTNTVCKAICGINDQDKSAWRNDNKSVNDNESLQIANLIYSNCGNTFQTDDNEKFRDIIKEIIIILRKKDFQIKYYNFAEIMGMNIDQCQSILDRILNQISPLLQSAYYDSQSDAGMVEKTFLGFYQLGVKRGEEWHIAALRVRYFLHYAVNTKSHSGVKFLRCKMNYPMTSERARLYGTSSKYWEYDGFLQSRTWATFWTFEKRKTSAEHSVRQDMFYFITNARSSEHQIDETWWPGTYLTTGQDENQTVVSGDCILFRSDERQGDDRDLSPTIEEEQRYMHTLPKILSPSDGDHAVREEWAKWENWNTEVRDRYKKLAEKDQL
jgi:hypothetical protein